MRRTGIIHLILAAAGLLAGDAFGAGATVGDLMDSVNSGGGIEWQKAGLEDRLHERLGKAIAPTVPEKHFVVNVSLELKQKPKAEGEKKDAAGGADRVPLGKLDLDAPQMDDDNLFKNIMRATVTVLLDKKVPESKKEVVTTIVKSVVAGVGQTEPEIKIDMVDLVPEPEPWDAKRWVTEFKTPIGVLIATVVLSLFALVAAMLLLGGYRKIELQKIAILQAQNAREDSKAQAEQAAKEGAGEAEIAVEEEHGEEGAGEALQLEGVQKGFDKFRALLKEAPDKAAALVRQWLKAPVRGASEALTLLPQMLATEELLAVFKFLSLDDRKEWKKLLGKPIDKAGAAEADRFVSTQIVDSLLVPAPKVEDDVKEMLADLKLSECVELANQDASLGALLINLLPTTQVARMLALMPVELANSVTAGSLKFSDDEIQSKSKAMKDVFSGIRSKAKAAAVPFIDRASELLRDVGPEKEVSIFAALAESGEFAVLEATARQFFPAELILKLPQPVLKACLDRLPLSRKADLLMSRAEEERAILLETIGKEGSKVRDVIGVELQEIASDEVRKRRLEKNKESIWREFIDLARGLLRGSESAAERADSVLGPWLSEKSNGAIGGSGEQSAAA